MPSDDAPSFPNKPVPSSFADVFRTLSVVRPKSQSPVSLDDSSDSSPHVLGGWKSSLGAFGFDPMHRGSAVSSPSDAPSGPDFETSLKGLAQEQNLTIAVDEAESVSRSLQWFSSEQSVALWEAAAYLLHHEGSPEARRAGSQLLEAVAARQDLSPAARLFIFESISKPSDPDVIPARVKSLISLSDHGRKLEFTSSSILPIVSSCIVPLYELISLARSKARKAKVTKPTALSHDEASLADLLQFAVDLMTLQRRPPTPEEIASLLAQVVAICKKTSVAADIKNSLAVFDAAILYADIPDGSFIPMLEILCGIHASVKSLSGPTSRAVRNLAKSRRKVEMVDTLNTFLLESSEEQGRNLNILRGTIYVLTDLVRAHGQEGIPQIPFEQLVNSLRVVAKKDDSRVDADILELCVDFLEGEFVHVALDQNWSGFVDLLTSCSRRVVEEEEASSGTTPTSQTSPKPNIPDDMRSNILTNVLRIATVVESLWDRLSRDQRLEMIKFLRNVRRYIEPSQASLALNTVRAEKFCFPEHPEWEHHCRDIINYFIRSPLKASGIRILAVEILAETFLNHESFCLFQERGFLSLMLENFANENDILFLESLVSFITDASSFVRDDDTFRFLVDTISSSMSKDLDEDGSLGIESPTIASPERHSHIRVSEPSLSNVCSAGLVIMFLRFLNVSANRAVMVFETLMNIAQLPDRPTDARLTALKLLFRLRCDSSGSIMVISVPEDDFLVNLLCLTGNIGSKLQAPVDEGPSGRGSGSRASKLTPPLWAYGLAQVLPEDPPRDSSPYTYVHGSVNAPDAGLESTGRAVLKANMWLETVLLLLQRETNWDVYSYVLAHLGSQLGNRDLFTNAIPQVKLLRSILCDQVKNETFREPPGPTGIKKADVASCIFESLSVLVSYHEHFAKSEEDDLIRAFMLGIIGSSGSTSRACIHALSICCHETPLSVTKSLNGILDKMSKMITTSKLAVHILEFLALLARLPDVYVNLREEEIRTVFGICIRFLQTSREHRYRASESAAARNLQVPKRLSGSMREIAHSHAELPDLPPQDGMAKYIYTLTHHVMVFWFLSMKLQDRAKHVNWIMSRLVFRDEHGKEVLEEQSQVFVDLMQRVAFSDLGDTIPYETFPPSPSDGAVVKKSWVVGMSIVTVETAKISGLTQIAKRQASGTTYAMYQQRTAPVLPHQVNPNHDAHLYSDAMRTAVLPNHVMLQLSATAFPTPSVAQPIPLPDDDITRRAISSFDRNDIVDGHKVGVIYVGDGQPTETAILSNTSGSTDYEHFLTGLGTKIPLQGAIVNTQGLYAGVDGDFTYAWRDRVTEIVYHVATMMPTDSDRDPGCVNKKRHIGNDHVNIVFNRSNAPFGFDTIPSQFNFVNIVISPVCRIAKDESESSEKLDFDRLFYHVQVISKPGFPEISPAASPKIISGKNLGAFVRILALNASVFSLIWNSHEGEHVSSWRNRLREIKRLRERAQAQMTELSETTYPVQRRSTHANIFSEEVQSRPARARPDFASDWNKAADGNTLQNLDFSRWSR